MPGQTLSEIRRLLAAANLAPRHRFGQHFLIDLNLMRKLVDAAQLSPADTVLEVGAGTGSLTELLLDRGVHVVAVEVDHGLQGILRQRLGSHPRVTLVQADVLAGKHRLNPLVLKALQAQPPRPGGAYKLVANLPYQIATPLLMDALLAGLSFELLACTIQREVAQRLGARPGTESYGPGSVIIQSLADIIPLAILPPSAFWPRPEVQSAMVTIRPRGAGQVEIDNLPGFVEFVHRGFQQRRKMLRRLLGEWDELTILAAFRRAGVSPDARAEQLSPAAWRGLFRALERRGGSAGAGR